MVSTNNTRIIFIIDDDEAVRDSIRLLLEACGYAVRDCASAEIFLATDSSEADCLLVDQHMPGMTGVELLEFLRRKRDLPPALMVTGRDDPALAARLTRIGVKLLAKPVEENHLVDCIEEACRSHTLTREAQFSQEGANGSPPEQVRGDEITSP